MRKDDSRQTKPKPRTRIDDVRTQNRQAAEDVSAAAIRRARAERSGRADSSAVAGSIQWPVAEGMDFLDDG